MNEQIKKQNKLVDELIANGIPQDDFSNAGKDKLKEVANDYKNLLNQFHGALKYVQAHRDMLLKQPPKFARAQQIANSVLSNTSLSSAKEYTELMNNIEGYWDKAIAADNSSEAKMVPMGDTIT